MMAPLMPELRIERRSRREEMGRAGAVEVVREVGGAWCVRASASWWATRLLIFSHVAWREISRAALPIVDRKIVFEVSSSMRATKMETSDGGTRKPLRSCSTISEGPPSSRAMTGRPLAMASRTTRPKVSVMDEWRKISEEA